MAKGGIKRYHRYRIHTAARLLGRSKAEVYALINDKHLRCEWAPAGIRQEPMVYGKELLRFLQDTAGKEAV